MPKEEKPTKATPAPLTTSIHIALANIMRDITAVEKARQNQDQKFMFRGIDDIFNALHPIFAAHGVVVLPEVLETTFERTAPNRNGTSFFAVRLKTRYTFLASDGTSVAATGAGEGFDMSDKALNKAQSAAYKYVLIQMFQIPTADLVDADAYDPTVDPRAAADPYAGKPLAVLEGLRDEQLKAGLKPADMAPLLGRIAELRVEAQDAAIAAPQPAQQAAAPEPAAKPANVKAKAEKPPKPAKEEKKPEPPKADVPPGAEDFSENEAPAGPDLNAAMNLVISPDALRHPDYVGKKLGNLDPAQIESLYQNWVVKFETQIKGNEVKCALRDAVIAVRESLPKTA